METLEYEYPVEVLFTGSSLGNRFTFVQLDKETNLKGLWSSFDNQSYVGEWNITFEHDDRPIPSLATKFFPESQLTIYSDRIVEVRKRCFVPFVDAELQQSDPLKLRAVIVIVQLSNLSSKDQTCALRHSITFPAALSDVFTKQPPLEQIKKRVKIVERKNACDVFTITNPNEARVFGSPLDWDQFVGDDQRLSVSYSVLLKAGEKKEIPFVIAFSSEGIRQATKTFAQSMDAGQILDETKSAFQTVLTRSLIMTPEPVLNRALQWAKVNTVRVQHNYRNGEAFTNDPPQDIVVVRDVGWYVLGSDYVTPRFSHGTLELCKNFALHPEGKLTEYIHANDHHPSLNDYKLNVNDDTPLLVYALYHHALVCENEGFLQHAYPLMKKACEWILSQIKDGLVRCYADGANVWGICSWRNIIDNYNLTGAVTEINAESFYALKLAAEAAGKLGRTEDASSFGAAAESLRKAMNDQLVSETTGLYVLNQGNDGVRHHDLTGDLIFPVLFDVAGEEMRKKILGRLTEKDFWTPYGVRTVSKSDPTYDPDFGYQLVGGVWPNLTAWVARCLADDDPAKTVEAMMNIYKLSEPERPIDFVNAVPGEFPERLHGNTFVSCGMAMSPWMPPTYFWLGIEGLLGVKPSLDGLEINPKIPSAWKWIAVRDLPYRGKRLTVVLYDGQLYTTQPIRSQYPVVVMEEIATSTQSRDLFTVGFIDDHHITLFAASSRETDGLVRFNINGISEHHHVAVGAGEAVVIHLQLESHVQAERSS